MMKVCVLQPDYGSSEVDYRSYDPPRDLSRLLPGDQVDHVFLNKLTTYKQIKALRRKDYDIFVNLCEAYLEWDIPSLDVVYSLELLDLPHTGPSSLLYDPPKLLMKYVAYTAGVPVPGYAVVGRTDDLESATRHLSFPLFVKPANAGDSLGVNERSLVHSPEELRERVDAVIEEYDAALVEKFISGREFTVLVAADPDPGKPPLAFLPVEFVFPKGEEFKTYDLKVHQWHPECNVPCSDPDLDARLRDASRRIFKGFDGMGYARLDFRVDGAGKIYFLEINFACSIFYPEGFEGSADYILKLDGIGQEGFLRHILEEGMARHGRKKKKYRVTGNSLEGFGICAAQDLAAGEVIWRGEERAQRLATLSHIENTWSPEEKETFRRYAYPVSEKVFILWETDPREWSPQNHSCDPNTAFKGLDVIALRDIPEGEELTLDYASFYNEQMEPFECRCGAPNCRGLIRGIPGNTLTARERN